MNGILINPKLEFVLSANPPTGIKKKCTKCGKVKTLNEYNLQSTHKDGRSSACKKCNSRRKSIYRAKNIEAEKERNRKWSRDHPENVKRHRHKSSKKSRSNPMRILNKSVSERMRGSLKKGVKAHRPWESLVGYTVEQLRVHLEKQFKRGMTWENHGIKGWHIDHKIPVSAFNFERPEDIDFKRCWELSNLQPMWWRDNLVKNNKLEHPFQPSLCI